MSESERKKAYDTRYESSPQQVRNREARNRARAELERQGKVKSGQDVDHKKPLMAGGTNSSENLRAISEHRNRGYRRGESGYKPRKV